MFGGICYQLSETKFIKMVGKTPGKTAAKSK
jgi:hypothetical protein